MIVSNTTTVSKIIDIIVFFMILLSQRIKKKAFTLYPTQDAESKCCV